MKEIARSSRAMTTKGVKPGNDDGWGGAKILDPLVKPEDDGVWEVNFHDPAIKPALLHG